MGEDAVLEFDATSTTMAGAQKELTNRLIQPRLLVVEEIEKQLPNALNYLLSVLDIRQGVNKVTNRGRVVSETQMLAIATVNDYDLFLSMMSGALASRFSNRVHFRRPTRETLSKILAREIATVGGDRRWISPTLDYAFSQVPPISDPREILAICLCGRDGLIDGSYQEMLKATQEPD